MSHLTLRHVIGQGDSLFRKADSCAGFFIRDKMHPVKRVLFMTLVWLMVAAAGVFVVGPLSAIAERHEVEWRVPGGQQGVCVGFGRKLHVFRAV